MTTGKRKDNPDWEPFDKNGRTYYRKKKNGEGHGTQSSFSVPDDFSYLGEERTLEDIEDDISDLVDNIHVDIWTGISNVESLFEENERLELIDYNDKMVDFRGSLIIRDSETGDYYSTVYSAGYDTAILLDTYQVREVIEDVPTTSLGEAVDKVLDDKEIADSFLDFMKSRYHEIGNGHMEFNPDYDLSPSFSNVFEDEKNNRLGFSLTPGQEYKPTDEPSPYHVDYQLWDNNEFQNDREYQKGEVFIDRNLGRGFLMVTTTSSDGDNYSLGKITYRDGTLVVNDDERNGKPYENYFGEKHQLTDDILIPLTLTDETTPVTWYRSA